MPAPLADRNVLIWEQEAAGSNPAIPTVQSCISKILAADGIPGGTVLTPLDVAL